MDDSQNPSNEPPAAAEPVRSRWTPKPEQILILESIFNSGMVNPPKDETVRIRKLLENFGSVGDANVFYWFQNRRSRSRRRQRQIQASLASGSAVTAGGQTAVYDPTAVASCSSDCTSPSSSTYSGGGGGPGFGYSSSSSGFDGAYKPDDLFSVSTQMRGFGEESYRAEQYMSSYEAAQMPYQSGSISVFINGVHTEVPRGPIDIRAMFGEDVILVHSSGEPLAINEHGILLQSLQMGESYYLVASSS